MTWHAAWQESWWDDARGAVRTPRRATTHSREMRRAGSASTPATPEPRMVVQY